VRFSDDSGVTDAGSISSGESFFTFPSALSTFHAGIERLLSLGIRLLPFVERFWRNETAAVFNRLANGWPCVIVSAFSLIVRSAMLGIARSAET
jgi:hypothetical protein